ncbi:MAG: hypothetical protein JW889_09990 [Verrucomicrobia bacterium]|nr:hypothetical protein [Verrucomicrobiota bacterium]
MKPSPTIEDFATVEATCDGVPVYAYGYTYIHGVSPDFIPGLTWQKGSKASGKLVPKKSWEIKSNLLGSTPAREPKSLRIDDQPLLCVHLIDGDPGTCWCSRGQIKPDVEPVWIRIDLPAEAEINAVRIVPHKTGLRGYAPPAWEFGNDRPPVGQALPKQLKVKVSRDAHHWETVFQTDEFAADPSMQPIELRFDARRAKQIWIIGEMLSDVLMFGYCFSIAGVEVIDTSGANLALHSRGAGVTVSSTHLGYGMDRFTQDMLWPIQYDLGFKWSRVGYDMSALQWAYVEREKGVFEVDARTDAAITEAVEHGIEVVLVLDKGNWHHAPEPRVIERNRDLVETYFNSPPWPDPAKDPEYFEAWLNYVRYMVRHFKGRIRYFEIWNEWNVPIEPKQAHYDHYVRLAKPTARVIREEYPEAKIVAVGMSGMGQDLMEQTVRELGDLIDAVGFHPYYNADPQSIREYPEVIASLRERLAKHGFHGEMFASEWDWFASYPRADRDERHFTEIQKAKIAARFATTNVALDIRALWNETFQTQLTSRDVSLLRNTFSSDPISLTQPQPVYYALRTLSTALEDVKPAKVEVEFTPGHKDLEWYALERSNGDLVIAVWLAGEAVDDASREHVTDIRLPGTGFKAAEGIDALNGTRHRLTVSGPGTLKAICVRDWPFIVVLSKAGAA